MIIKLFVALLTPLLVGFLGSLATASSVQTWYPLLTKPPLNPPNWIFAPMWTAIYILIGINFYLLWQKKTNQKITSQVFAVFLIQLGLNAVWSPIFFGLQSPFLALIIIVLLLISLIWLALQLKTDHALNFWLLLPYLMWVAFAAYLNLGIFLLNSI